LISWRLRRFRTPTSPISVIPTVHQKHGPPARWVALTDTLLRLRAEMKLPGKGWLQFQVEPQSAERSDLIQTALFEPKGLGGILYWYFLYPVHRLIFSCMIRRIAEGAEGSVVRRRKTEGQKSIMGSNAVRLSARRTDTLAIHDQSSH
jgi:hypothetical protein